MSKRSRSRVDSLPRDLVEIISARLPVKSLVRFKTVDKLWKSVIESHRLRQLIHLRQSRGLDVLFVSFDDLDDREAERRIMVGSSTISMVRFPTSSTEVCHGSCDGLLCLYGMSFNTPSFIVNPATRWLRRFPLSRVQELFIENRVNGERVLPTPMLGFGKSKETGTHKAVWLYNSLEFGLNNATTCEIFDFTTNDWRYLLASSPYRIISDQKPVYLHGSVYWFTEGEDTKVLSLDLQTETFQVITSAPFSHVPDTRFIAMCVLNNALCVCHKNGPSQSIWSLEDHGKTWKILISIDLEDTQPWFLETDSALLPIAILGKKLVIHAVNFMDPVVIYDLDTKSFDLVFTPTTPGSCVSFSPSLFSV